MYKTTIALLLASSLYSSSYDNKFEVGLKTTIYDYTEKDEDAQILDTEESSVFDISGIYGSYEHKLKESANTAYYINIFASVEHGETDYTGSILGSSQGFGSARSTTENSFYEYQVNFKSLNSFQNSSSYALIGLGYKEWERKLSKIQLETYHYIFAQVAIGGERKIYNNLFLGLDLSAQLAFKPKMDAVFAETIDTNPLNETFDLGRTYSYKVAVPLTIPIQENLSFVTKAEYEFTKINISNKITKTDFVKAGEIVQIFEPESQQKNWHLYAGFQLLF